MKNISKILLVLAPKENPVRSYPGSWQLESEDIGAFPPLGLFYLQATLKNKFPQIQTKVLDTLMLKMSHEDVRKYLIKERPDVVGLSSFSISWVDILKLAKIVKKELPETKVILGGPHTFEFPKETLTHPEIDAIFIGESEESLTTYIQRLLSCEEVEGIRGVFTLKNVDSFVKTDACVVENLDTLPFPLLENYEGGGYQSKVASTKNVYIMICSRGCPFSCTFCNTMYKRYRARSIENIIEEVDRAYKNGFGEIFFFDDTFNITKERVQEIARAMMFKGIKMKWTFRGRVSALDEETIALAKQAGLRQIHIGIETGTNEGLVELKKGTTIEQVKNVIKWARKHKVRTIGDFMLGLPFEKSEKDVKLNVRRLIDMDPDFGQFSALEAHPGTAIFAQGVERGRFTRQGWEDFVKNPTTDFIPPIWGEFLSREQLIKLSLWAYKKFYFRPKVIWRYIKNLESPYDFYIKARGAIRLLTPRQDILKKIKKNIWNEKFILLIIIFLALILRLNALTYLGSAPVPFFASESTPINTALRLLESKSLNLNIPSNNYQPFLIYANMLLFAFTFAISLLIGIFQNIDEMKTFFILDRTPLLLISRIFIGILSAASVYFLYKATKRLFNKTVGLVAAFFFAIELIHISTSHIANIWTPTIFFLILSFDQAVKIFKTGHLRAYFLSTLFAVLSYASHLIGGIAIIPLIVAHFLKRKKIDKKLIFSGILFVLSIILLFFLDRMQILWEFGTKAFLTETCASFNNYYNSWVYPLKFIFNFHPLLVILSLASIFFLVIHKKHKELLLILPLPVFYYFYIGPLTSVGCYPRFFTIFIPFLIILAAYAIVQMSRKKLLLFFIVILFAVPSLYTISSWSLIIRQKSTNEMAQEWVYENLPENSKILVNQRTGQFFLEKNEEYLVFIKEALGEDELTQRQKFILNLSKETRPSPAYFVVRTDLLHSDEWGGIFRDYEFDYYIAIHREKDIPVPETTQMLEDRELIKIFKPSFMAGKNIENLVNDIRRPFEILPKIQDIHGNTIEIYKLN